MHFGNLDQEEKCEIQWQIILFQINVLISSCLYFIKDFHIFFSCNQTVFLVYVFILSIYIRRFSQVTSDNGGGVGLIQPVSTGFQYPLQSNYK